MDSSTRLDRALFQLTPTRTRFELVLFHKNKNEKIASGLFEPFISHLKSARDQISKGGYSISFEPPSTTTPWFTKATFQRFVQFVSTPAVLERFVGIENEISQIERQMEASKAEELEEGTKMPSDSHSEGNDAEVRENSKIQLQRLLATRKILLQKEQAMAYARGVVAGFETDDINDLILFADVFGASRLREACTNFKEVCKKKRGDGRWMEELAAVEASLPSDLSMLGSSGIVLANETVTIPNQNIMLNFAKAAGSFDTSNADSTPSSDNKTDDNMNQLPSNGGSFQVPMPWPNQMPPYLYNFQGPPPYPNYPFAPMHHGPPQDPRNMPWGMHSGRKGKSRNKKEAESSEEEEEATESSGSDSENDLDSYLQKHKTKQSSKDNQHGSKHKKKSSSRTVIIRNINYITEKKNGEKDQVSDETSGEDKVNNEIENSDGLSEKRQVHKGNENWDTFQNLLMNDEEIIHAADFGYGDSERSVISSSEFSMPKKVPGDSFIVTQRNGDINETNKLGGFENGAGSCLISKRKDGTDDSLLLPHRVAESGNKNLAVYNDNSITKSGKGEDWFVADHNGYQEPNLDRISLSETYIPKAEKVEKNTFMDDSFMVQARPDTNETYVSHWKSDISMVEDQNLAGSENMQQDKNEATVSCEPNDLCMVLERNSGFESVKDSWNFDYGIDLSLVEATRRNSDVETANVDDKETSTEDKIVSKSLEVKGKKDPSKITRPRSLNGSLGTKKVPPVKRTLVPKSKLEREEEMRRKVEELAIQRQQRIAERTAAAATKKVGKESKALKAQEPKRTTSARIKAI